jgi:hypothetical protein
MAPRDVVRVVDAWKASREGEPATPEEQALHQRVSFAAPSLSRKASHPGVRKRWTRRGRSIFPHHILDRCGRHRPCRGGRLISAGE